MPRYRTFHHLEEYLVSNLPYRTYSISLEKAEPRSEEGVHKEGEETVIKLVDKEDLRNGGIVGGDDRSVRVGDQVGVQVEGPSVAGGDHRSSNWGNSRFRE